MNVEPFRRALAITPHDSNASISGSPVGIYVGGAGNITMKLSGSADSVLFTAVPVGTTLFVEPTSVLSTGTTATALVALYE